MDAAATNHEKPGETNQVRERLGSVLTEKSAVAIQTGKAELPSAQANLPKVEFIISRGQEDSIYRADGSVSVEKSIRKIDPNCRNGVRASSDSEQRFDSVGLCKVIGNVRWGKSNADGNWQLVSVKGEQASYKLGDPIKHLEEPKPAPRVVEAKPSASGDKQHKAESKTEKSHSKVITHPQNSNVVRAIRHQIEPVNTQAIKRLDPTSLDAKLKSGLY
jgi:hypothetical protein